ncbi:MAG: hypothetical protein PWP35_2394 [Bacteroidales bacterium]|jgi:hypothetical protein|nr:hypothetical protein [Bacteroidales bacterium]
MRLKIFTLAFALSWAILSYQSSFAQLMNHQIITVNGGKFESTPPYTDYVTVQTTHPETLETTIQGTIFTQSVQDVIAHEGVYYVSSGDSVIKFDGNTHQRLAVTRIVGANKLALYNDLLLVSRQFPAVDSFLYILSADNLNPVKVISEVSGESAGILCTNGIAFVAVNYGWAGTTGKIAQIDLNNLTFLKEDDLGPEATGIFNIYMSDNQIVTVNKTPWGGINGFISTYKPLTGQIKHYEVNHVLGPGYGIYKGQLFVNMDGNIGTIDLDTYTVADSDLITNPYASVFGSITSAVIDTLNSKIYFNAGDYFSFGQGFVYTTFGDSLGTFTSGISAEGITIDYQRLEGASTQPTNALEIYPNPFISLLNINSSKDVMGIEIFSLTGQKLVSDMPLNKSQINLNLSGLKSGIYLIKVSMEDGTSLTHKIIKR